MMQSHPRKKEITALVGLLLTAVVVWLIFKPDDSTPPGVPAAATTPELVPAPPAPPLPPIIELPTAVEHAAALNREDESPETNVQAIEAILYAFRQGFGENPVGQNEDITAALLGDNPKRAAYLPKNCPAIVNGKLVDRWGTPYWFHPLSGKHMEIRSAGPDKQLFTGDDVHLP